MQFESYLAGVEGEEVDPTSVDARRLRAYSAWMSGKGYAPSTVARRLASLRSFYRYQRRQGVMTTDPVGGLRNPKQPRRLPKLLRVEDVIRLLDGIPTADDLGVRDRAMFETLYGGGLRVGELVGLDLADLDEEQGLLRVRGKGRRERLCPVGPVAVEWLGRWKALRRPRVVGRAGLLPQSPGDPPDLPERRPAPPGATGRPGFRPLLQPSHPPAQLRHPPSRRRRRSPERPGPAGAPEPDDHPDLHPCDPGAPD